MTLNKPSPVLKTKPFHEAKLQFGIFLNEFADDRAAYTGVSGVITLKGTSVQR